MRLFHSLWTKPALDKRWNQSGQLEANLWLYTLSVIFAKQQGFDIVLHTDTLGKKLLGHLPYNQIYTTLDKIPSNIPTMIWAYGKFQALKEEPLGSIHIDGDVLLTNKKLLEALEFNNTDLIIQNIEGCYTYMMDQIQFFQYCPTHFLSTNFAYNCGIIGINNSKLKQQYLDFYFQYANKLANNTAFRKKVANDKNLCPDLVLEQWALATLAKPYKVKKLLCGSNTIQWHDKRSNVMSDAAYLGYIHLIGKDKYKAIEKVKFYILALDKDLYYKTKEIIEKHKNILS